MFIEPITLQTLKAPSGPECEKTGAEKQAEEMRYTRVLLCIGISAIFRNKVQ